MYAIINIHHDDWIVPLYSKEAEVNPKLEKLWTQIANHFKDYGNKLIFETLNEPETFGLFDRTNLTWYHEELQQTLISTYNNEINNSSDNNTNIDDNNNNILLEKVVTVYSVENFKGKKVSLTEGTYTLSQLNMIGIKNNDISSIEVKDGYKITLFENDNFEGRQITKTSSTKSLINDNFDNIASSIKIEKL